MAWRVLTIGVTLATVAWGLGTAAAQGELGPTCADAPEPVVFADGLDRLENIAFDGDGHVYVTSIDGELRRFTPDGSMELIIEGDTSLGGLAFGPTGELYVGVSVGLAVPAPVDPALGLPILVEEGVSEVWRFDQLFPPGPHTVYVDGLDSANGLATDPAGNLYISEGFEETILKVPPGGEPQVWTTAGSPNGLVLTPDEGALYAAISFDPEARILEIDLDDPDERSTVAALWNEGLRVAKLLDDLDVGPEGEIYVTAHASGEVLRVDPQTGAACVLAVGLSEPSAAAVAEGFGEHTGKLFVTEFGGRLVVLDLPQTASAAPAHSPSEERRDDVATIGGAAVLSALVLAAARRGRR